MNTKLSDHLEKVSYFQVVGELGSIQDAARKIGIAQPALSKSIKILESAVGCLLLERTRKGTILTREGKQLLKFSYGMQDLIKNFESKIGPSKKGIAGAITIGTHELYVPNLWPNILDLSARKSPDLELNLVTDVNAFKLIELVKCQKLDIAIAVDSPIQQNVSKSLFYEDQYSFYSSSTLCRESKNIEKAFYLSNSVVNSNQNLQDLLIQNGFNMKPAYSVSSYASILSLVLSGVGIGILPDKPASFYVKRKVIKKIKRVKIEQIPHKVFIYTRSSSADNLGIRFFISQVLRNP